MTNQLHALIIFFGLLWPLRYLSAHEIEEKEKPLPIGNFSVPVVTQIAPLISFGQLLVGERALLPQLSETYTKFHHQSTNVIMPTVIYGIRDDLDVVLFVPWTPGNRSGSFHSSGMEDMIVQLEYEYYSRSRIDYVLGASLVANVQFPTGSSAKTPRTGNESFTYFLGTTLAYLSYDWYAFTSYGANLTTTHHRTKIGNSYLYQWGFARYIKQLSPRGYIFDVMVEFDGTYTEKDKVHGTTDPNSGGNIILLTPSIWLSSARWILQLGISLPIMQQMNGTNPKVRYSIPYTLSVARQF